MKKENTTYMLNKYLLLVIQNTYVYVDYLFESNKISIIYDFQNLCFLILKVVLISSTYRLYKLYKSKQKREKTISILKSVS